MPMIIIEFKEGENKEFENSLFEKIESLYKDPLVDVKKFKENGKVKIIIRYVYDQDKISEILNIARILDADIYTLIEKKGKTKKIRIF